MSDEILIAVADGIATVTLNRPEQRNAMNAAMLRLLGESIDSLDARNDVRVIVFRGAGPAFCSGRDLKEMEARVASNDPDAGVVPVLRRIEGSRHATIAVVHGDAIAGGCELALHCDLRLAAEPVRFGMPLTALNVIDESVTVATVPESASLVKSRRPIEARRAFEIGMIHQVVSAAELETAAATLARTVADNAPLSLAGIKAVIQRTISAREQIPHEDLTALSLRARQSADASEGRRAMLEKRKPVFRGE